MGLYGTLGLVGALALSALLAVWLFYSRSRREDFPEDTWDPYLGKKEDTDKGPGEGVEDISGVPGGAGAVPLSSRLQRIEAIPSDAEEESQEEDRSEAGQPGREDTAGRPEEAIELIGGESIPPGGAEEAGEGVPYGAGRGEAVEEIGVPVPAQGDMDLPDLGGGGIGGGPAPPPPSEKVPWWEGVSSSGDVPFRRTVAELMGVAIAEPSPRKSVVAHLPGLSDEEIAPEKGEAAPLPDISREISLAAKDAAAGDESAEDREISLSEPSYAPEEGEAAPLPDISREISLAAEDAAAGDESAEPPAPVAFEDEAAGDESVEEFAEPPAPVSFEDEAAGDESAEPPAPVSLSDEVESVSGQADEAASHMEDKGDGEEDSFTLESLVLEDDDEAGSPVMYEPEQVPEAEEAGPTAGAEGAEEEPPEIEPEELEPEDHASVEGTPPPKDDFQPDIEDEEETPLVLEEEEEGQEFFDAEEAQKIPAGLDAPPMEPPQPGPAEASEPSVAAPEEMMDKGPPGAGPEDMKDEPAGAVLDPGELEEAPAEEILAPEELVPEEISPEEMEEEGPVMDSSELEEEPAGALLDAGEMEDEPPEVSLAAPEPAEIEEAPAEVSLQTPGEEEGGEDVFSVIERERSETPEEMPLEPIGNAALFDEMADEERPAENVEASVTEAVRDFQVPVERISLGDEEEEPSFAEALESSFTQPEEEPPGAPSDSPVPDEGPAEPEVAAPPPAEAPLAAVSLEGDSAGEKIQNFISEYYPNELLLIEEKPHALPAGLEELAASAWNDIRQRLDSRQEVGAEEILRVGILEQVIGRFDEALARLKEALRRADRMGPVLNALGVASHGRGKTDPAISYCKEAMREAGTDVALMAAVNRNLAVLYQTKGEYERAAEALVSAIKCSGIDESPHRLGGLHLRAGQLFRRLGDAESARHHLSESAHLFLRAGDDAARIRSLVALSAAQTELRDIDAALKNLGDAALLCRSEEDKAGEALVFGQMGIAYSEQDQYTRALEHYEKAIGLNRELGNRKGEGANLSNIGNIHYFRGDLEEARTAYEEALAINREEDHLIGQATILGNLGRIHLEQGLLEEAGERLNESQRIFRLVGAQEQLVSVRELLDELDRSRER